MGIFSRRKQGNQGGISREGESCYKIPKKDYDYNPNFYWAQCPMGVSREDKPLVGDVTMCCVGGGQTLTEAGSWGSTTETMRQSESQTRKEADRLKKELERQQKELQKQNKSAPLLFAPSHY